MALEQTSPSQQCLDIHTCSYLIFKPGAHWPVTGARLVSYNCFYADVGMCVCVCVSAPEAINN